MNIKFGSIDKTSFSSFFDAVPSLVPVALFPVCSCLKEKGDLFLNIKWPKQNSQI